MGLAQASVGDMGDQPGLRIGASACAWPAPRMSYCSSREEHQGHHTNHIAGTAMMGSYGGSGSQGTVVAGALVWACAPMSWRRQSRRSYPCGVLPGMRTARRRETSGRSDRGDQPRLSMGLPGSAGRHSSPTIASRAIACEVCRSDVGRVERSAWVERHGHHVVDGGATALAADPAQIGCPQYLVAEAAPSATYVAKAALSGGGHRPARLLHGLVVHLWPSCAAWRTARG